jgi:PAT family beta-lactamase induction signal transducer AmpG
VHILACPVSTSDRPAPEHAVSAARALVSALRSRRTASVALLSFSSGLPLGLVWIAIPDWMRSAGFDIRVVGLATLIHAPWTFKMLWSPLMDRYAVPWLGRRRGWIALTQLALFALTLALAGAGHRPETPWVVLALGLAIAIASASQDIVVDAYAVEVLRSDEQGIAVGARTALYRAAMYVAGAIAITLASRLSWPAVNAGLAALYLPMLLVTRGAPEPDVPIAAPVRLRDAVWHPLVDLIARHRAIEILAFVLLYKMADNLAQSLQRPFLVDMGYDALDRGVALGTVGLAGTIVGTFLGGALTTTMGLGRSLWVFGALQIVSNFGFVLLSTSAVNRPLMYGAMAFETLTTGLGMGAFGVLLLRLTQKRFSATQYALLSSIFALPRLVAGPLTGVVVHVAGWTSFYWFTIVAGLPGLVMLARFVPIGCRDPVFAIDSPRPGVPFSRAALVLRAAAGGVLALGAALGAAAALEAAERMRSGAGFAFAAAWQATVAPQSTAGIVTLGGCCVFAAVAGLGTAAVFAARGGDAAGSRAP